MSGIMKGRVTGNCQQMFRQDKPDEYMFFASLGLSV
jgi:hypothetical protein